MLPVEQKRELLLLSEQGSCEPLPLLLWLILVFKLCLMAGYLVGGLRLLGDYERRWRAQSSDTNLIAVAWLRRLLILFLAYPGVGLIVALGERLDLFALGPGFDQVFWLMMIVLVFVIAYWCLSQPGIVQSLSVAQARTDTVSDQAVSDHAASDQTLSDLALSDLAQESRYSKSGLSAQAARELADQLLHTIQTRQLHLQAGLKLADLASASDAPPHLVSQAINQHLADNFFDLINRLRVDEVRQRLGESRWAKRSIADIAADCGFNNRMSFNTAFRKHVGSTPSSYRKSLARMEKANL